MGGKDNDATRILKRRTISNTIGHMDHLFRSGMIPWYEVIPMNVVSKGFNSSIPDKEDLPDWKPNYIT